MDDTMEVMENCRICLEQPAVLDWNEEIPDTYGTTYKYCYYKYTHLDDEVADYYPQMLCETCSNDLKSCYFLIQKALESYSILQQTYCHTNEIEFESDIDIDQEIEDAKEFETEVFKKPTESLTYTDDQDLMQSSFVEPVYESCEDFKNELVYNKSSSEIIEDLEDDCSNENTKLENHDDFPEDAENIIDISPPVEEEINYPQYPPKPKPVLLKNRKIMCAYCPKLIVELKMKTHERTHEEHRERSETCPKCGLKMFNKTNLRNHMKIHDEKREKRYKCEFCEKAYFNRGALNVHRRIHLGQLIPCPICPKKFYRQVDLEKHKTTTHSANIEDTNYKFTKYYVECKDCGKNILTQQWKHHALMHLNKMQMKCTLCDKHFASKITCHKHVRKTHKYKGSFAKVVEYYGAEFNIKHSHLMLKQFEIIKPVSTNNDTC